MIDLIFWTILVLSFAMSYAIGANDAANALGTSYGSNAARLWLLLGLGAIFELVGAVWCSAKVAGTLADKLIPPLATASPDVQSRLMLGICISSFSFILVSSVFGMPISGTHTVIGALIGAGLAAFPADELNWKKFGMTVASWFISPVLSSLLAGILFLLICSATLGGNIKGSSLKMQGVTMISGVALAFSAYMVIGLAADTPSALVYAICIPGAFLFGVFQTRLVMIYFASSTSTSKMSVPAMIGNACMFWSFESITSRDPSEEVLLSIYEKAREVEDLPHNVFEIRVVNKAY
jgi:hypothetical protein